MRAYLHGVYGRTVDAGNKPGVIDQDFFRLGPKVEIKFDKLITTHLTLKVDYEYLADLVGQTHYHGLLSIEPAFVFNPNEEATLTKPIISLMASYQNGGVDLTKEKVRTLFLGLGITL